jgi:purine nucleoside permease
MAMRCKTPNIRMLSQDFATSTLSLHFTNGLQFKNKPMAKMRMVLLTTFKKNAVPFSSNLGITKAIALPTAKRKKGNTKSVGVHPCQGACSNGGNIFDHEPGLFTKIINATVAPLKTSKE